MPQVPMSRTQPSQEDLAAQLIAELTSLGATATTGALLLALSNQETGTSANMWNWNVGNITTADDSLDWWSPTTGAAKGLHFRAYETLDDGVRDFVRFIAGRPAMFNAAGTGDVSQFAQSIRDVKYNPELDVASATPTLYSLAKQAAPLFTALPTGPAITLSSSSSSSDSIDWRPIILTLALWFYLKGKSRG